MLLSFVKPEFVTDETANGLVNFVDRQLKADYYIPEDAVDIGSAARKVMKELKADKAQYSTYKTLCMDITKFLERCVSYLVTKLPLSNMLPGNVACLSLLNRQQPTAVQMILAVVDQLPYCSSANIKYDILHQWQTYAADKIPEEFFILHNGQKEDGTGYVKYRNVDEYWHKVLQLTDTRGSRNIQPLLLWSKWH
jgi:hypothetical protein